MQVNHYYNYNPEPCQKSKGGSSWGDTFTILLGLVGIGGFLYLLVGGIATAPAAPTWETAPAISTALPGAGAKPGIPTLAWVGIAAATPIAFLLALGIAVSVYHRRKKVWNALKSLGKVIARKKANEPVEAVYVGDYKPVARLNEKAQETTFKAEQCVYEER